jgi:hypothetical protein
LYRHQVIGVEGGDQNNIRVLRGQKLEEEQVFFVHPLDFMQGSVWSFPGMKSGM